MVRLRFVCFVLSYRLRIQHILIYFENEITLSLKFPFVPNCSNPNPLRLLSLWYVVVFSNLLPNLVFCTYVICYQTQNLITISINWYIIYAKYYVSPDFYVLYMK